jgi:hypothetical protein
MDNGPEFIAKITAAWSEMHGIGFKYIYSRANQPRMLLWNGSMEAIEEVS